MSSNLVYTILTRGASTGINFLIAVLISRHAGPGIKGETTLLITLTSFIQFFSSIFGGQVLVVLLQKLSGGSLVLSAYIWSLTVALLGWVILWLTDYCPSGYAFSVAFMGLLSSLTAVHYNILLWEKRIRTAQIILLIPLVLQLITLYLGFYCTAFDRLDIFVWSNVAGGVVVVITGVLLLKSFLSAQSMRVSHVSDHYMPEQFKHGLMFQATEFLQLINFRYVFLQLGLQQGSRYLGIFSIGISILETVWIISRSIATVHFVGVAKSGDDVSETYRHLKLNFLLTIPLLLMMYLLPVEFYTVIFGPGFADIKHGIRFLFPGILAYGAHFIMAAWFLGRGRYKQLLISNLTGSVVLIVTSVYLIPQYVMSGAGLSASIAYFCSTMLLFLFFFMQKK